MSLEEKKYDLEANNDWAKNVKGEHLFIDNAESGRKGYYCIGCDKQMEAVKKKNLNHRSYFRHIAVDINKDDTPCTFSNQKYREKLASDILQRIKTIKVPNVFKYPPRGEMGGAILLEKAKYITAKTVKSELTFYEDSSGNIRYGKNPDVEDRYLLIRPDVTFFDAEDKPILFIELVVTHKVSEEKKIKLRRLGVDTISVLVPRSSEQEIEDNFKTTKRVKWEYNEIEANTEYLQVSSRITERVLEFDEDQRRFFEESLTCRKTRLNNTLRTIKRCIQSEPYRRIEQQFRSEISRIEESTERVKQELQNLERQYEEEVFAEFEAEYENFEREKENFRKEEDRFQNYIEDLEKRYLKKDRDIKQEKGGVEILIIQQNDLGRSGEEIKERFARDRRELEEGFESKGTGMVHKIEIEARKIDESLRKYSRNLGTLRSEEEGLPIYYDSLESQERQNYTRTTSRIREEQKDIEQKIDGFGEYVEQAKTNLGNEFKRLGEQSIKKINNRDSSGDSELSKRIRTVLEIRGISRSYPERQATYERYKSYLELVRSRPWEK